MLTHYIKRTQAGPKLDSHVFSSQLSVFTSVIVMIKVGLEKLTKKAPQNFIKNAQLGIWIRMEDISKGNVEEHSSVMGLKYSAYLEPVK